MRAFFTSAALLVLVAGAGAGQAHAQPGTSAATPFPETSAGRAMRRITFAAIDCVKGNAECLDDAFTTSRLFNNGTYQDTRLNYGGNLNQADVSNSLLLLILTQSQTFPNPSTASGFTFRIGGVVPVRESDLYGPLFGERALTNGRQQLSVSFNVNRLRFRSIDGSSIRNSQRGLLWGDTDYDGDGSGYVGICRMNIDTTIAFAAANYGVLDALDVSPTSSWTTSTRTGRSCRSTALSSRSSRRAATTSRGRPRGSATSRSARNTRSFAGRTPGRPSPSAPACRQGRSTT
jgi:hypothetical protein